MPSSSTQRAVPAASQPSTGPISSGTTTTSLTPSEHLVKRGWLWKRAVGKSVILGRKNWKLRFIESDTDSIRYYSSEPFTSAQSCVYWSDVIYVYDKAPAGEKGLEAAFDGNRMGCARPPQPQPPTPHVRFSADDWSNSKGKAEGGQTQNNKSVTAGGLGAGSTTAEDAKTKSLSTLIGHDESSYNTMYNNSYSYPKTTIDSIEEDPLLGDGANTNDNSGVGVLQRSSHAENKANPSPKDTEPPLVYLPTRNYFDMCAAGENQNNYYSASAHYNSPTSSGGHRPRGHTNFANGRQHSPSSASPSPPRNGSGGVSCSFKANNASREVFYFGVRFKQGDGIIGKGSERVLLFRTDDAEDHKSWVRYFKRVAELYSFTDDEGEDADYESRSSGVVERVSRKLRTIVSLQKKRFTNDGFDLDLSYVLPNVIAMGFPCEGREELFRNPMSHVVRFFETYHKKEFHVINLCSERFYLPNRFGGKFDRFPFDDHNPCPLQLLYDVCENMFDHLMPSPTTDPYTGSVIEGVNPCLTPKCVIEGVYSLQHTSYPVVAVHCKAGKGRTGLVICAYLMYAGICDLPSDSMSLFAARRTKDGKGIQIPSQRRYLDYFYQSLHNHFGQIPTNVVRIRSVSMNVKPKDSNREYGGGGSGEGEYYVRIEQRHPTHHRHVPMGQEEGNFKEPLVVVHDTSRYGHFAIKQLIEGGEATAADPRGGSGGGGFLNSLLRKKPSNEELNVKVNATLRGVSDFRVALYSVGSGGGRQGAGDAEAVYWCSVWLHTGFLPAGGTTTIQFSKFEIDDAAKDKKHNRFPPEFRLSVEFSVDGPGPIRPAPKKPIPCLDLL